MKILHVIPYFTPKRGGDVSVCYNITKILSKRGHDVTIITTDFELDEEYVESLQRYGINILIFKCIFNLNLFLYSPEMKKWVESNLKSFDLIHLHNFRSYQNNLVHKFSLEYGIPYVLQPDGSTSRKTGKKILKWIYDIFYGYNLIKNAKKIIAVSKEECKQDYKMGASLSDISVIYTGMDTEIFKNLPEYGEFRLKHNISHNKMILYIGRLNRTKGIEFAIKSFEKVTNELDDLIFVIAGYDDSNYLKELKKLVKSLQLDNVKFLDFLTEEDKVKACVDADVFIHTVNYMGGVGIIPLESILCRTPVIVTEGCGELIKELNCGSIVNYGAVEDLKYTIKYLIENPSSTQENVEKGRKYILENLNWNNVLDKVEEVYEDCIYNI